MFNSDFPFKTDLLYRVAFCLMDRKEKVINSTKFVKSRTITRIKLLKFILVNCKYLFNFMMQMGSLKFQSNLL